MRIATIPIAVFTFISVLQSVMVHSQNKIYFNDKWEETTEEKASYYRTIEKTATGFTINDYYIDGNLQFTGNSTVDKEPLRYDGAVFWYYKNGNKMNESHYINNVKQGTFFDYYSNGKVKKEYAFKNDILDGKYEEKYPWGAVRCSATFKNALREGQLTTYTAANLKKSVFSYEKDLLTGPYEIYYNNGNLNYKGTVINNVLTGDGFVYHEDGKLRMKFTVKDKLLTGHFFDIMPDSDTIMNGMFDKGKVLWYRQTGKKINSSDFRLEEKTVNGMEVWKLYRDGALVVEYFYKEGKKTGVWKIYTFDGLKLYETRDYSQSNCSDKYLQSAKDRYEPFFFLSERFNADGNLIKDGNCEGYVSSPYYLTDTSLAGKHPIYFHLPEISEKKGKEIKTEIIYSEFARNELFITQNNCVNDGIYGFKNLNRCEVKMGDLVFYVYTSLNKSDLLSLETKIEPKDNEIHFFYQEFESKNYPKEYRYPERFMDWKLTPSMAVAIKAKYLDEGEILGKLESEIFEAASFSGFAAGAALNKAIDRLEKE